MAYHVEIIVIDDSTPLVAADRPEVVKAFSVGHNYSKLDLALKFALRTAEIANVNEARITGKR